MERQNAVGDSTTGDAHIESARGIHFKDSAIVRYKNIQETSTDDSIQKCLRDGAVKVVSDTGLSHVFGTRTSDNFWKKIDCIQTNVKCKIGCGFPYIVHFFAKIEGKLTPESKITYDYKQFEDDLDLIRANNPERYCLK